MTFPVTIYVVTKPYKIGVPEVSVVIGEVKRGDELLHTNEITSHEDFMDIEQVKDIMLSDMEIWAFENTD